MQSNHLKQATESDYLQFLILLDSKQPSNLTGVLTRVKRYVLKAEKTENFLPLCQEMKELSKSAAEVIGTACSSIGISPNWLNSSDIYSGTVTNHAVIELQQYRYRKGITWKTVRETCWSKLFHGTVVHSIVATRMNWFSLAEKKKIISRNSSQDERGQFLCTPYVLPQLRGPKKQARIHMTTINACRKCQIIVTLTKKVDMVLHLTMQQYAICFEVMANH